MTERNRPKDVSPSAAPHSGVDRADPEHVTMSAKFTAFLNVSMKKTRSSHVGLNLEKSIVASAAIEEVCG